MLAKKVMTSMYAKAQSHQELPWYRAELPALLHDALRMLPEGARVLDVGCGAGTLAVQIAKQGFDVTGVDMIPRALELAAAHARDEGVSVRFVEADVLAWNAPARFDLVVDSGCLHSLIGHADAYKERLLSWLAPGGSFVLGHWGKRHALDWRPIGPRRRTRRALVDLFAPELEEHACVEELMTNIPMPFGPSVLGVGLWLERG
jgi:SAM-dependent methyltransferase